jgi:hormone-sensitive lipase
LAYCPVMVSFVPSPARLLCLMDPLLPFGFMMRCLKAYTTPTQEVIDANRQRVDEQEAIRTAKPGKTTNNNTTVSFSSLPSSMSLLCNEPRVVNGGGMSTCSSSDNSRWDQICADSNGVEFADKLLSPVSGASSDTFAGASFKSQDASGNTIEIISPGESNTATSLEEDSQPITWHRSTFQTTTNTATEDDVNPLTMDEPATLNLPDSKTDSNQYVSEFIERYVLDSTTGPDGEIRPILKPISRTRSEENIVFDVGRETMSVHNLHERLNKAAGNLMSAVTNTFSNITASKQIKTSNSCSSDDYKKSLDALIVRSVSDEFIFQVPTDPLLSPYFAGDDVMRQMPATKIVVGCVDSRHCFPAFLHSPFHFRPSFWTPASTTVSCSQRN